MRTLRIRKFTVLGLIVILLLPWIFFLSAHFMQTNTLSLGDSRKNDQRLQSHLQETIHLIETGVDNWTNPHWQNQLQAQLRQANIEVAIVDAADQEIYRSNPERKGTRLSTERFSMVENGRVLGRAENYLPYSGVVSMIAAFAGLLAAFISVGLAMRWFILNPLGRMSLAARQIAEGDWEVQLPSSRITEISEVRDSFKVMVKGLQQSHQKQVQLEEERRFVIAAVAHDLRTPLFALRGYLEGIEQGIASSPDKLSKYLAVCREKSAQLDRLVEDLFTFTKVEYLEAEMSRSALDFKGLMQKAVDSLSPRAAEKHISVLMNRSSDELEMIGDSHLMERALNNLLDNAIRHTPEHGKIYIQCCRDGDKLLFTIQDTGPGFTSEELPRVFEPLYRGEVSRNRSTGGAGLGLTISRRIIRRHGGELAAGNHPDGGALLSGCVPVAHS